MNAVNLPSVLVDELLRLAQRSPEEEICGLIARDRNGHWKCYPVPNRAEDRRHFFVLDAKTQIDAMRSMREHDEELAAIYHTHPDAPAYPSPTDVAQHQYPDTVFLIISLVIRDAPEIRGFYIRDQRVTEIDIAINRLKISEN